jgi:putative metalloenzyme radical SAM/SPASM domain maturase
MNSYRDLKPDAVPPNRRPYPSKLFVEATTRCNLGCFMCVKQAAGCEITDGNLSPESFSALETAFPHLEALILNGIGEPLLNPNLEAFIRRARLLMPATGWIGFQSNGQLMTNLRAMNMVEAGLDRICLSMDAASPETFKKIREGSELPDIQYAMAALATAKANCNRPDVKVGIEFVLMRSNLAELPVVLRWAADHGASFAIVTHVLPYDEQHAAEAVYGWCSSEVAELFESCKAKATRQGLDISRYFEACWKYQRDRCEQKLVELVEEMKNEAYRRGLFVDMKKLLQMDSGQAEEVAAAFAQARAVAEECGLELRLPEVSLREERRCSFVEEGSAFVSWEGNVSPCYFLWHHYSCFASGWRQQVRPKVFGNLDESDILQIWNNQEFQLFRNQATAYDYPTCSSCSLAPCDYIQTDNFEQDCHISSIPCGSCLWCMGIFQCLR